MTADVRQHAETVKGFAESYQAIVDELAPRLDRIADIKGDEGIKALSKILSDQQPKLDSISEGLSQPQAKVDASSLMGWMSGRSVATPEAGITADQNDATAEDQDAVEARSMGHSL